MSIQQDRWLFCEHRMNEQKEIEWTTFFYQFLLTWLGWKHKKSLKKKTGVNNIVAHNEPIILITIRSCCDFRRKWNNFIEFREWLTISWKLFIQSKHNETFSYFAEKSILATFSIPLVHFFSTVSIFPFSSRRMW